MSATDLGAVVAIVVGYAAGLTATLRYLGSRIDNLGDNLGGRIDNLAKELADLRVDVARIGQRLDDHITDHPGPSHRVLQR